MGNATAQRSGMPPAADQLNLLDFPELPLALIWHHICKLPMHDRCALLAACKDALGTFGEITDRMERLQLTLGESGLRWREGTDMEPCPERLARELLEWKTASEEAQRQQQQQQQPGPTSHAAKVLSWFPNAEIGKLVLHCAGTSTWQTLQSFTASAACRLKHVTALELKGPQGPEVRKYHLM